MAIHPIISGLEATIFPFPSYLLMQSEHCGGRIIGFASHISARWPSMGPAKAKKTGWPYWHVMDVAYENRSKSRPIDCRSYPTALTNLEVSFQIAISVVSIDRIGNFLTPADRSKEVHRTPTSIIIGSTYITRHSAWSRPLSTLRRDGLRHLLPGGVMAGVAAGAKLG